MLIWLFCQVSMANGSRSYGNCRSDWYVKKRWERSALFSSILFFLSLSDVIFSHPVNLVIGHYDFMSCLTSKKVQKRNIIEFIDIYIRILCLIIMMYMENRMTNYCCWINVSGYFPSFIILAFCLIFRRRLNVWRV